MASSSCSIIGDYDSSRRYGNVLTDRSVENGRKPISAPPQPGCWMVAPLLPHAVQRARSRSTSLDASRPQRMTATAHASGA